MLKDIRMNASYLVQHQLGKM
uniref:Uncharacterized protein n=1 Tax=Anguilla anguilla TaxID=7936 RepID=A0A0E9UJQ5_ANGAN